MDAAKQREIASKGGRAAHAKGTAHEFTSDEARVAGRKGGEAVSRDRTHMATIGREGGHSRGARARAAAGTTSPAPANGNGSDVSQDTSSQPFVRQANEERSGFEATPNRGNFGSQQERNNLSRDSRDRDDSGDNGSRDNRDRF